MPSKKSKKSQAPKSDETMGTNTQMHTQSTSTPAMAPHVAASSVQISTAMSSLNIQATPQSDIAPQAGKLSRGARRRANQKINAAATNSTVVGNYAPGGDLPRRPAPGTSSGILSVHQQASSQAGPTRRTYQTLSHPPATFTRFPCLPVELRVTILELACYEPRIIEMEIGPNLDEVLGLSMGGHKWRRVSPRSRVPPALFSVNRLAREVAGGVYQFRSFDSRTTQNTHRNIYFNKEVDILYFGESVCISTLIGTMQSGAVQSLGLPKVAILCSGKAENCCDWDEPIYGIDGGVDTMQALHGFDDSIVKYPDWTVNGGLRDVYFVVNSNLWRREGGTIDSQVAMRPHTNQGLTKGQIAFKDRIEAKIQRVEDGHGLAGVGQNMWVGASKPNFHFVSFCPKTIGVDDRVYDGMCLPLRKINLLKTREERIAERNGNYREFNDLGFIKYVARTTGCEVMIPEPVYYVENPREIGFFGTRVSIEAAKAAIKKRTK